MSVGTDLQAASPSFDETAKVAIAQLNPEANDVDQSYIEATVALIWPYSSSTQQLTLLLADKDIRRRKSKGQVKVIFNGDCARAVANTHVGIGDSIRLGLEDVTWARTGEEVSTPGKKVDWDIVVNKRARLEVQKEDGKTVVVDIVARYPAPQTAKASVVQVEGPQTNGYIDIRKPQLSGSQFSPANRASHRTSSGSFVDATLDPFAEHDGYIIGRGRKRTRFSRHSGSWRLLDAGEELPKDDNSWMPPSPLPQYAPRVSQEDMVEVVHHEHSLPPTIVAGDRSGQGLMSQVEPDLTGTARDRDPVTIVTTEPPLQTCMDAPTATPTAMAPPALPGPSTPSRERKLHLIMEDLEGPALTPTLKPVASPGLALVSPLVQRPGLVAGYFPLVAGPESELDMISHIAEDSQSLLEQASVISRTDATGTIQAQQTDLDIPLVDDLNVIHNMFVSNSANDVLGSGQMPGIHGEIAVPESIHDPILDTAPGSAISIVDLSTPSGLVDLEALQRQIDDASDQWQAPANQPQAEDDDMYGPHVVQPTQTQDSNSILDPKKPTLDAISPQSSDILQSEQILRVSTDLPQQRKVPETGGIVMEQKLPDTTVVIDSSSEENEDEVEENDERLDGKTNAVSLTAESGVTSPEEALLEEEESDMDASDNVDEKDENELTDLEEALERELGKEELQVDMADIASSPQDPIVRQIAEEVQAPGEILELTSSAESLIDRPLPKSSADFVQDGIVPQTDGMVEACESQTERDRLRHEMDTKEAIDHSHLIPQISSSPVSRFSVISEDKTADGNLQQSSKMVDSGIATAISDFAAENGQQSATVAEDETRESVGDGRSSPYEPETTTFTRDLSDFQQGDRVLSHLMTPDATQQTATTDVRTTPFVTKSLPTLPLSPDLTQGQKELTFFTSPVVDIPLRDQSRDTDEPSLPKVFKESHPPSESHRLSKKYFTSEFISTEYFTPRRSVRLGQLSPPLDPAPILATQQPSSPTRPKRILRSSSPALVRHTEEESIQSMNKSRGATTALSYYPRLSTLRDHYNHQIDVMAVCPIESSRPERAKSGPKDHYTTVHLADPSLSQDNTTVPAQIFRPRMGALPMTERGDIILLRDMKVQSYKHKVILVTTDSSSWAVFRQTSTGIFNITTAGPPVEHGDAETTEASLLLGWWSQEGSSRFQVTLKSTAHNSEQKASQLTSPMLTRSQRRRANTTDNSGNAHEQEQIDQFTHSSPPPMLESQQAVSNGELPSPTVSSKQRRHRRADSEQSESVVHELRDGTTYINSDGNAGRRSTSVIHELRDGSTYVDD